MEPYIIELSETESKGGKLSFIENPAIPFDVKRLYWIYDLQDNAVRGGHSHLNSDRVLICLKGRVEVELESSKGQKYHFELAKAREALYFPRKHWIRMRCSEDALLLTLTSCKFEDDQYQKDYDLFRQS
ncbi:WxcM-like protein [Fulvivirga imtechensis AK7]|uniref:WxcM-like protein n=1 Tax=Fulvivirga imtechensis AK7 TaxID=1237149 RepID=L8JNH1_9BACT|nr:FdtA/QdtA family cupin domain-containing protein [Fulvivirga imtechensis]ELR70375.1 WxcM-like protein [Fulvivirga imtechensis AK7]